MSRLALRTARPREDDGLLLRAAFLEGPASRSAYDTWISRHDPRHVPAPASQFLPALYRNLQRQGVTDGHTQALRERWLQSWSVNARLLQSAAQAIATLEAAGLPTVLLKGAALVADGSAHDEGSRVMADADLLIPYSSAAHAAATLEATGWRLAGTRTFEQERQRGHSTAYQDGVGSQIDLHWRATFDPADDTALIHRRVPAQLKGQDASVPAPCDQLLLTCLHGVGWHGTPLRWIADSTLILRRHPDLDWDALVTETRTRRATHRIASQLELLQTIMDAPISTAVIGQLRTDRLTGTERVLQRAKDSPHWGTTIYLCSWDRARRTRALPNPTPEPYMTFALLDLGLTQRRQLLRRALTRPLRHLRWISRGRTWN